MDKLSSDEVGERERRWFGRTDAGTGQGKLFSITVGLTGAVVGGGTRKGKMFYFFASFMHHFSASDSRPSCDIV